MALIAPLASPAVAGPVVFTNRTAFEAAVKPNRLITFDTLTVNVSGTPQGPGSFCDEHHDCSGTIDGVLDIVTSDDFWVNVADGRLHMGGDFVYANLSLGQSFDAFGVDIRYTHPDQTFNWWNDGQPGRPLPDFLGVWFKHDPVGGPDDPFYGEFQFLTYTPCFDPNFQCWGQDPNVNDFPQISFDNLAFHTLAPATSVPEPSALLLVAGARGAGAGQPGTSLGLSARLQPLPDLSSAPTFHFASIARCSRRTSSKLTGCQSASGSGGAGGLLGSLPAASIRHAMSSNRCCRSASISALTFATV